MTTKFTYSSGIEVTFAGSQITSTSYSGYPVAVDLGSNITTIGPNAFKDISLGTVTFADYETSLLQSIGAHAFENTKLRSIVFPNSLTIVGEYAFANCADLTGIDIKEGSNIRTIGSHCFYKSGAFWDIDIPNTVMNLGEYCFYNTDVSMTTLPCSLSVIPAHAFENTKITTMKIPSSITHVGDYSFASMDNTGVLATLTFVGSKLQVIGEYAFYGNDIATVSIPISVSDIGDYAFTGVGISSVKLSTLVIPTLSTLKTIGDYAFYDNTLSEAFIPLTVTSIGDYAFANNSFGASDVTLAGSNLKTIGDYAFANNSAVNAINIPHSVTAIGPSAFFGTDANLVVTFSNPTTSLVISAGTFGHAQLPAVFSIINFVRHGNA